MNEKRLPPCPVHCYWTVFVCLCSAGGYATDAFEDVGHSVDARDIMKKYAIGKLAEVGAPSYYCSTTTSYPYNTEVPMFQCNMKCLQLNSCQTDKLNVCQSQT